MKSHLDAVVLLTIIILTCIVKSFVVSRDLAFGYSSHLERTDNSSVVRLAVSKSQRFFFVCKEKSVFVYHVHAYPLEYPDWPYLFYGVFHIKGSNSILSCGVSTNDDLYLLTRSNNNNEKEEEFRIVFLKRFFTKSLSASPGSGEFTIVHPRDAYGMFWNVEASLLVSGEQEFNDIDQMVVEEGGKEVCVVGVDRRTLCYNARKSEWKKAGAELNERSSHLCSNDASYSSNNLGEIHFTSASQNDSRAHQLCRISKDQRLCACVNNDNGELIISSYVKKEVLRASVNVNVVDLEFFHFNQYYLNFGLSNGQWTQIRLDHFKVPESDPMSRLPSFYLDPWGEHPRESGLSAKEIVISAGVFIVVLLVLYSLNDSFVKVLKYFDQKLDTALLLKFLPFLCIVFHISFCLYEIGFQPTFLNDFPAHIRHIEQIVIEGTTDYSKIMHYHGPCTYPSGFVLIYTILYFISFRGNVSMFQLYWSVLEIAHFYVLYKIFILVTAKKKGRGRRSLSDIVVFILMCCSNRLHLYNVRVVINDFIGVFLINCTLLLILKKKFSQALLLFSFVLTFKLNFLFYLPPIICILFCQQKKFIRGTFVAFLSLFVILSVQIAFSLPFIFTDGGFNFSYFRISYNLKRVLLWEKTRYFKFVGRSVFHSDVFGVLLLGVISILLGIACLKFIIKMKSSTAVKRDETIFKFFYFSNFLFIAFARGLYTPFMCWYFYTFSLLMFVVKVPFLVMVVIWIAHEVLFRVWGDMEMELFSSLFLFFTNMYIILKEMVSK